MGYVKGEVLDKLSVAHPFLDINVPVILVDHVTTDSGTGIVHTAPGHGQEDYVAGQAYGLEVANPVGANGVYLPDTPIFAGQHVFKANPNVIELLQEKGALLHHHALEHSYPHCWRHKTPLFSAPHRSGLSLWTKPACVKTLLPKLKRLNGYQDGVKAALKNMVEGRPDWCISRQRTWGVPIALFVDKDTGDLHPNSAELIEQSAASGKRRYPGVVRLRATDLIR